MSANASSTRWASRLPHRAPADQNGRVADVRHLVPPTPPPGGWGEVTPDAILTFNKPEVRAVGVPGGGGVAGAAQLAMFYQGLINGGEIGNGGRIMKAETIEWATKVRTKDFHRDLIFNIPVNRALTVVVAGDDGLAFQRGFGRSTSPRSVRARRRRRPDRLGRPGDRNLRGLLHRWLRRRFDARKARGGHQQPGGTNAGLVPTEGIASDAEGPLIARLVNRAQILANPFALADERQAMESIVKMALLRSATFPSAAWTSKQQLRMFATWPTCWSLTVSTARPARMGSIVVMSYRSRTPPPRAGERLATAPHPRSGHGLRRGTRTTSTRSARLARQCL